MEGGGGLGEAWRSVVRGIEALGPRYPAVNRVISLGLDVVIRRVGVRLSGVKGGRILDAGAGDGSLSKVIWEEVGRRRLYLVLLDPSERMLRMARNSADWSGLDGVVGLLEYAPFRPSSLESAFMAFALRDVIHLSAAVERLSIILKPGGVFTLIDIAKPDCGLARQLFKIYWWVLAPLLVASTFSRAWREIRLIYTTFLLLPVESELIKRLCRHFRLVRLRRIFLGGAHILVLKRLDSH
ncbi:MAG: class I SAM-dependent methyltransferase [Aigarchaeota archaeon]|nr:class I SAM-dependent methyltransferase [Candidatus Calditenuaceae archaeon]